VFLKKKEEEGKDFLADVHIVLLMHKAV